MTAKCNDVQCSKGTVFLRSVVVEFGVVRLGTVHFSFVSVQRSLVVWWYCSVRYSGFWFCTVKVWSGRVKYWYSDVTFCDGMVV